MSYTMTINEAKTQIKNTVMAYLKKDENENYIISVEKQRPVFLLGAPGIGKTAIMAQVANELGINLVAYSMTHHTRQSAIGLPVIKTKNFSGKEYSFSDYTMSEIISSVYESIEKSGIKEGILFLDEINCVSETLSPAMLQFLQYKVFGKHQIPEGWVIVTAGNPMDYNSSAKDFDIATSDRLKIMEINPSFTAWKEYAYKKQIIPEIISFLENRQHFFYVIEEDIDTKKYITPRGWEDLSDIIKIYRDLQLPIESSLIYQYIHHEECAEEFYIYYKNFSEINKILACKDSNEMVEVMQKTNFNSNYAMIIAMIDNLTKQCANINSLESTAEILNIQIKELIKLNKTSGNHISEDLETIKANISNKINSEKDKYSFDRTTVIVYQDVLKLLNKYQGEKQDFSETYNNQIDNIALEIENITKVILNYIHNIFTSLSKLEQSEIFITIFMREITINNFTYTFISQNDIPEYSKYSYLLKLSEMEKM